MSYDKNNWKTIKNFLEKLKEQIQGAQGQVSKSGTECERNQQEIQKLNERIKQLEGTK